MPQGLDQDHIIEDWQQFSRIPSSVKPSQREANNNQFDDQLGLMNLNMSEYRVYFSDLQLIASNKEFKDGNKVRTHRYALINWLPLSLLYQFKRISNTYFLIISILTFFPFSPKSSFSMVSTFAFVLLFTMLKEAYEDYQRFKYDKQVNERQATVLNQQTGCWDPIQWQYLREGQLLRVSRDEEVPADILLIMTSDQEYSPGLLNVDTISLDGESTLKEKQALFRGVCARSDEDDIKVAQVFQKAGNGDIGFNGVIISQVPNENLEHWDAKINFKCEYNLEPKVATIKNLLLRGSIVRNTNYGIGIIVYSGMQTKIMKNLKPVSFKTSNIMDMMNKMLYTVFALQIFLVIILSGLNIYWGEDFYQQHHTYLHLADIYGSYSLVNKSELYARQFFLQFLVYWVAYSHMIPISLYVVIEALKIGLAAYINQDRHILVSESHSGSAPQPQTFFSSSQTSLPENPEHPLAVSPEVSCRNLDLIEELGQVQMIFCDKTGSLTQNKMIFRKCQINGVKYGEKAEVEVRIEEGRHPVIQEYEGMQGGKTSSDEKGQENESWFPKYSIKEINNAIRKELSQTGTKGLMCQYFENLALCNTVTVEKESKKISYKATSPDELALVFAAKYAGSIQLIDKDNANKEVKIYNLLSQESTRFKVIAEFPFDSNRKRMSVLVKNLKDGRLMMYSKGADIEMIKRINFSLSEFEELKTLVEEDLQQYSKEGLRTLIIAGKQLSKQEYKAFKKDYKAASMNQGVEKEMRMNGLYEKYEKEFKYLGITAVEDKLQEGVPATLATLNKSNIRFYILTGDKIENTIELAHAAHVIQDKMKVILIKTNDRYVLERNITKLVESFKINLEDHQIQLEKLKMEDQVIAIEGPTLAMIQNDPDIEKMFYHLSIRSRSVLFCRLSPKQKADIVKIFKSRGDWVTLAIGDGVNDISMINEANIGVGIRNTDGTQAIRQADFSITEFQQILRLLLFQGRTAYLRISQMICYYFYKNIVLVFTEFYFAIFNGFSGENFFPNWLPLLYNAIFTSWHCLIAMLLEKDVNDHFSFKYSQIYQAGQLGRFFNFKIFWKWIILAVWHGAVSFFLPLIVGNSMLNSTGQRGDHWHHSTTSFSMIINLIFLKLMLETRHLNLYTLLSGMVSLALYYSTLIFYSQISNVSFALQPELTGVPFELFRSTNFWLVILGGPLVCLIPDIFLKIYGRIFNPTPVDKILILQKNHEKGQTLDLKNKEDSTLVANQSKITSALRKKIAAKYDFSEEFKHLSKQIELRKIETSISSVARKEQISLYIKRKMKTEVQLGQNNLSQSSRDQVSILNAQIQNKNNNQQPSSDTSSKEESPIKINLQDNNMHDFTTHQNTYKDRRRIVNQFQIYPSGSGAQSRSIKKRRDNRFIEEDSSSSIKSSSLTDSSLNDSSHQKNFPPKQQRHNNNNLDLTSDNDDEDEESSSDDNMVEDFDDTMRSNQGLLHLKNDVAKRIKRDQGKPVSSSGQLVALDTTEERAQRTHYPHKKSRFIKTNLLSQQSQAMMFRYKRGFTITEELKKPPREENSDKTEKMTVPALIQDHKSNNITEIAKKKRYNNKKSFKQQVAAQMNDSQTSSSFQIEEIDEEVKKEKNQGAKKKERKKKSSIKEESKVIAQTANKSSRGNSLTKSPMNQNIMLEITSGDHPVSKEKAEEKVSQQQEMIEQKSKELPSLQHYQTLKPEHHVNQANDTLFTQLQARSPTLIMISGLDGSLRNLQQDQEEQNLNENPIIGSAAAHQSSHLRNTATFDNANSSSLVGDKFDNVGDITPNTVFTPVSGDMKLLGQIQHHNAQAQLFLVPPASSNQNDENDNDLKPNKKPLQQQIPQNVQSNKEAFSEAAVQTMNQDSFRPHKDDE